MACIENVNACENRIRANGKQCMMQMPVRTAEQLYRDDSHLVLDLYVILYYEMTQFLP